mmetsp:Transcript_4085/g.10328  ORF Transcript_4085/g.10328 Transcript_4085/m.10328 type:complete len:232 (+) Transcript_4085:198-893(+)|eukprot:jgi/Tetstr1/437229/TSEL_025959.t1
MELSAAIGLNFGAPRVSLRGPRLGVRQGALNKGRVDQGASLLRYRVLVSTKLKPKRIDQSRLAAQIQPYGPGDEYDTPSAQQVFSFLTPEGVFQFTSSAPGSRPAPAPRRRVAQDPLPTWQEQGLCIASTFCLAATNGRDLSRRVIWQGYAQSVPHLVEAVEDTVLWRGGKVALQECRSVETCSQALDMIVVLPFLWSSGYSGSPELDTLNYAITEAGGVIEAVKKQWHMT